jgi:hypothetical protein
MEKKISAAIAISLLLLAIGLFFGFVTNSYAISTKNIGANDANKSLKKYQAMVPTSTVLRYSEILLNRSSVARKLKFSGNHADKARYAKAMEIYQKATQAYKSGDDTKAKKLAGESIRIIAKSIPRSQHYSQVAGSNNKK